MLYNKNLYIRFFIGFIILIIWVLAINIGNSYDYIDFLKLEIYPYDVDYPWNKLDYILNYVDITFLFFIEKHLFIIMIYIVMIFTLLLQLYIFVFNKQNLIEATEFNLNIPPLLGVIGTIYAFASFVATEQNAPDVILVLKENFNSAAMTTILGGITYTINFLILVINEQLNNRN